MRLEFLILSSCDQAMLEALVMQIHRVTGISQAAAGEGFAILSRSIDAVVQIPAGKGFVVGTLFSRHGPARSISQAEPHELDELVQANGMECLRDRFWGGYVALLVDGSVLTLLRDPSGAMPCYMIPIAGGWAAASDVSLLVQAGLFKPEIAWGEIPRYLAARDLPDTVTAIEQVRELLPGTYVCVEAGLRTSGSFWSPWNYVSDKDWPGTQQMEEKLRRTVDHCVASWASTTSTPLLTLSGGFDSSVVAAALQSSRKHFCCLTICTSGGLGNERDYARAMADAVGARIVEEDYDLADIDLSVSAARHFPKPIGQIHETAYHATAMRVAEALEADAIYTGSGGDNVFYNSSSVRPLLDCLRANGVGLAAFRTLRDISDKLEVSKRAILWEAARHYCQLTRPYAWQLNLDLMSEEARQSVTAHPPSHSWLDDQQLSRPGKVGHIALLLRVQNHLEGYLRTFDMPLVNPLMSQPIVELALSIPTWHMVRGGRDRAVARAAYDSAMPPVVRDRRRKGSPSSFAVTVLRAKRQDARERLLDGELVRRGLIDKAALIAALSAEPGIGLSYVRILGLLDMEAWISHWRGQGR
ncbi:asparagine synthase (glutamine-hydrolysing) [Sphingobium sp. AP50]|uniref:asparagine synthase-related protein n=1 Tax=Sphingobium sp. AP50 TaxID=1884369 RepID=UPI0008D24985|nr:asparagine synthetase B family protein [Sphingobium sp. AP50]SEJ72943.1 asparagine synthase (glutamine-hydrolysing) [Sphingobium sp. AP50]